MRDQLAGRKRGVKKILLKMFTMHKQAAFQLWHKQVVRHAKVRTALKLILRERREAGISLGAAWRIWSLQSITRVN